jgi:lysozyme
MIACANGPVGRRSQEMSFDRTEFEKFVESLNLTFIKAYELLEKGDDHANKHKKGFGKNTDPPRELWKNIGRTVQVLDELRRRMKSPIMFNSVYRSPAYNDAIGGEDNSQHTHFRAVDFVLRGTTAEPPQWAAQLRAMRQEGFFKGGIGLYKTFVHVDTRGRNVDWP